MFPDFWVRVSERFDFGYRSFSGFFENLGFPVFLSDRYRRPIGRPKDLFDGFILCSRDREQRGCFFLSLRYAPVECVNQSILEFPTGHGTIRIDRSLRFLR